VIHVEVADDESKECSGARVRVRSRGGGLWVVGASGGWRNDFGRDVERFDAGGEPRRHELARVGVELRRAQLGQLRQLG